MTKLRKVYVPPWIAAFGSVMTLLVWGLITYLALFTDQGRDEMGVVGWAILSLIVGLVLVMLWLMGSRRLPAYLIEDDDGDG